MAIKPEFQKPQLVSFTYLNFIPEKKRAYNPKWTADIISNLMEKSYDSLSIQNMHHEQNRHVPFANVKIYIQRRESTLGNQRELYSQQPGHQFSGRGKQHWSNTARTRSRRGYPSFCCSITSYKMYIVAMLTSIRNYQHDPEHDAE